MQMSVTDKSMCIFCTVKPLLQEQNAKQSCIMTDHLVMAEKC